MRITNEAIARQFDEVADLLSLKDANPFRVRAYRNAARTISRYGKAMSELVAKDFDLTELPGIGEDLAGKIKETVKTGKLTILEQLHRQVPPFLVELLNIPRVGPKRALLLWHKLRIRSREQLLRAARDGRLAGVKGLGLAFERSLRGDKVVQSPPKVGRTPISVAMPVAERLRDHLRRAKGVRDVVICGSLRRHRESIGDIDLLVTAAQSGPAIESFTTFKEVGEVFAAGETRATVFMKSGMQADLRVVEPASFGSAVQYLTGSKEHSIALRRLAKAKGLKLNEYGVYRGTKRIAGETEEQVYAALGLPLIPPELRENRGEIEAAQRGKLPELVEAGDLKGDLHAHVDLNGVDPAWAAAAKELGYAYLGLVVRSTEVAQALERDRRGTLRDIEALGGGLRGVSVFRLVEAGVGADGKLDLPDDILARFDAVIGCVHDDFDLSRQQQTERQIRAMKNPLLTILAQPSRTLTPRDAPYDADMTKIIAAAKTAGVVLEITADPARLDVGDFECRQGKDAGVPISLSAEARTAQELSNVRYAGFQARRGWLEARDVLNTLPFGELTTLLRKRRRKA